MFKKILVLFLLWRAWLFFISFIGSLVIKNFGNRFPYKDEVLQITQFPSWIWSFGNFDGVHYLKIAQNGYADQYSQAFFPLYPILINKFSGFLHFWENPDLSTSIYVDPIFFISGLFLSNLFFLIGLYFFYKLVRLDYSQSVSFNSLIFLMVFPTTFYFGAIYSESLFFLLTVLTLYLIRKKFFIAGSVIAAFASATRVLGVLLLPVILVEIYRQNNKDQKGLFLKSLLALIIAPLGLVTYMLFQNSSYNDPLFFLTSQPFFGAERSSVPLVLLPQVIYRYFKIFFDLYLSSAFLIALIELIFTLLPLFVLGLSFRKIRFSYWFFTLGCILIPTLTGTLSSMPRYSLMAFLLIPFILEKIKSYYIPTLIVMVVLQAILTIFFIKGYWIA